MSDSSGSTCADFISKRELYRDHLVSTLQLARAIRKYPENFTRNTRVYFCLPLGLESTDLKTLHYRKNTLSYLVLPGGHICASTFIKFPLAFQEHLHIAAEIASYHLPRDTLISDPILERTFYATALKHRIKCSRCIRRTIKDCFYHQLKFEQSVFCPLPESWRGTDYFDPPSALYQLAQKLIQNSRKEYPEIV